MSLAASPIIPTVLTDAESEIQFQIDTLEKLSRDPAMVVPSLWQVDIIDGLFAPNLTVFPQDLTRLDWKGFSFEVHLLTNDPEEYLGEVAACGAKRVIAQIEHLHHRRDFLEVAQQLTLPAGLALDVYTPTSELTDDDLHAAQLILLLSVPAGFSGQSFNPQVLAKIQELRQRGYRRDIEIDGGINSTNSGQLIHAGASQLAVNSGLWHDGTVKENLQKLLEEVNQVQK